MLATRPTVGQSSRSSWPPPRQSMPPTSRLVASPLVWRLPVLAVLLAAFWLRMRELGLKSLWLDEGISVIHARDGVPGLFTTLAERDLHPPLYYLTLYVWMLVGGATETAVRFPSVVAGLLLIATVHRLAGQLYAGWVARATGLLAVALLAWSPFLLYHAQEARMYGPLALSGTAATCGLCSAFARGRARRWVVYGLLLATAPYLHLFGWLVVAAHGTFVLLSLPRLRRRALGWAAAAGLAVLLYLPWFPSAVRQVVRLQETPDFWQGALSLWFVAERAFAAFSVGFGGALERYPAVAALFAFAFLTGASVIAGRGLVAGRPGDLLLVLYLLVPLAAIYAIVARNPKFDARYVIVALPPFALLLARGLVAVGELGVRLRRSAPAVGYAAVVLSASLSVGLVVVSAREADRVYWDEPYKKDDFRSTVDYMIGKWQRGDAVLLMLDTWQAFDYYSHGLIGPRYGFGPTDDLEYVAGRLNGIVEAGHPRLWVVLWSPEWADPTGSIRGLLDETATRVQIDYPGARGLPLRLYSLADRPRFVAYAQPTRRVEATFDERLQLLGLDGDLTGPIPAGSTRRLTLHWQPRRAIAEDLRVSLRLVGRGQEWWRHDARPAADTWPTFYWRPERPVRGSHQVAVPVGTPPGRYRLEAVVYDGATQRELPVPGGRVALGEVVVVPPTQAPAREALPVPPRSPLALGPLSLVGSEPLPPALDAGSPLRLSLAWQAAEPGAPVVDGWLRDAGGRVWSLWSESPAGDQPARRGDLLVDRREAIVPPGAAAGRATLLLSARASSAPAAPTGAQAIGEIEVRSRPRVTQPPTPQRPIDAAVGEHARLVGVDHAAAVERGAPLPVRLHWRSVAETRTGYVVFVHVVGADDRPVAQHDGVPGGGALPTTGWLPGEYVADEHPLTVPVGLAPGEYRLVAGMYDPRSGQRAPVGGGDRVPLGTIAVR